MKLHLKAFVKKAYGTDYAFTTGESVKVDGKAVSIWCILVVDTPDYIGGRMAIRKCDLGLDEDEHEYFVIFTTSRNLTGEEIEGGIYLREMIGDWDEIYELLDWSEWSPRDQYNLGEFEYFEETGEWPDAMKPELSESDIKELKQWGIKGRNKMELHLVATIQKKPIKKISVHRKKGAIPPPVVTPTPQPVNPPAQTEVVNQNTQTTNTQTQAPPPKWMENPCYNPLYIGDTGQSAASPEKAEAAAKDRLAKGIIDQFHKQKYSFSEQIIGAWVKKWSKIGIEGVDGHFQDQGWNRAWATLDARQYGDLAKYVRDHPTGEQNGQNLQQNNNQTTQNNNQNSKNIVYDKTQTKTSDKGPLAPGFLPDGHYPSKQDLLKQFPNVQNDDSLARRQYDLARHQQPQG
jgi:hypothetical protein